jgi:predicted transcriptional regulator
LAGRSIENRVQIIGNRIREEILADILSVACADALKTHIMYKANLSHRQLEKYLELLTAKEMIMRLDGTEDGGTFYRVTQKGIDFLNDYARVSKTYGPEILRTG